MGEDLGWVIVGFDHHCPETGCLDGGDAATNIGERKYALCELAGFAAFAWNWEVEFERVLDGVDDRFGHFVE